MGFFLVIWPSGLLIPSLASLGPFLSLVFIAYSLHTLALPHGFLTHVWEAARSQAGLAEIFSPAFPAQSSPNKDRPSHVPESCLGKAGAVVIKVGTCMKYAFVSVFVALNQVNKCLLSAERGFLWDLCKALADRYFWGHWRTKLSLTLQPGQCEAVCCCWKEDSWGCVPARAEQPHSHTLGSRTSQNGACKRKWLQNRFASGCCRPWSSQTGWRGERLRKILQNYDVTLMGPLWWDHVTRACYRWFTEILS